ncbi:MFS transporter [Aeromonas caviae]|uniref:MFS transporter n=1 Tax=Aeromonas caviae TaxID=648 RepID=UPI001FC847BD|nr:MFS transporter [Aeromonas caviae]GKR67634.1 MFS transporter [Aeromonas caviae]
MLVLVILIALNLRPFLTAIGPLAPRIDARLALGVDTLAWVTLLPLWLIGVGVLLTPALLGRTGPRPLLGTALLLLALGSALRLDLASGALLIASAALCGLGSALVQGVLPGLIKEGFAQKVPLVMGIFSACMMGGGALGAVLTPRLAEYLDWSRALALWGLPVLLALGWLAPAYMAAGWSAQQGGELVAWLALAQTASGLGLPLLAAGRLDRRPWMALAIAMQLAGFGGLWLAPQTAPLLWCLLCGAGLGGSFSLIMVIALDHLPDPRRAGALCALMQGVGFMVAATGPWVAARLHHASGDFAAAWQWQLGALVLMSLLVVRLNPRHYPRAMGLPPEQAMAVQTAGHKPA